MVPHAAALDLNSTDSSPRRTMAQVTPELNVSEDGKDVDVAKDYEYTHYKPSFPKVDWVPLEYFDVADRGDFADPEKRALLSAAIKVTHLTSAIGTEIEGIDLRQLSGQQKDELALLVAERGVVFFRNQPVSIYEQLELGRHWGRLHKHSTGPVPQESGLEEVHLLYHDAAHRPNPATSSNLAQQWHSDVTYELQPPSITSLKGITIPPYGGDTLWSSGYALYSSLSPGLQAYLEGLTVVHRGAAQTQSAHAAGTHVRRPEIETIHPIVRVHPVTGWKSIYVDPGFSRRIVGVPKAESDAILQFLFHQISDNPDFQVRFRWEKDSVAIYDNRVVSHTTAFDFWPHCRHALRVTPHGEKPLSVADYERSTGKQARDRQKDMWERLGLGDPLQKYSQGNEEISKPKGYND